MAIPSTVAARAFNRIDIDTVSGCVTKWSASQAAKIGQEIDFYRQVPEAFASLFPSLVDEGQCDGGRYYTMGYVPLPSLSQVFVDCNAPVNSVQEALTELLRLQSEFAAYEPADLDADNLYAFYGDKTDQRLAQLPPDGRLAGLLALDRISINGQCRAGWSTLKTAIAPLLKAACVDRQGGFVHGDLCFSNVLWDAGSRHCRLIDPRGRFLDRVNWGDARYDIAKLLHSAHGGYDFVIHDRFDVEDCGDGLHLMVHDEGVKRTRVIGSCLIHALRDRAGPRVLAEALLLEGLLFMSMVPLHYDMPKRQLAFLAIGIELLNRCVEGRADAPVH